MSGIYLVTGNSTEWGQPVDLAMEQFVRLLERLKMSGLQAEAGPWMKVRKALHGESTSGR
jgi:hypothetical protein